jgi:hypothetical protein
MTSLPVALTILWILNLQPSHPRLGTALTHEGRLTDGVSAAGKICDPQLMTVPVGATNDLFTANAGLR